MRDETHLAFRGNNLKVKQQIYTTKRTKKKRNTVLIDRI